MKFTLKILTILLFCCPMTNCSRPQVSVCDSTVNPMKEPEIKPLAALPSQFDLEIEGILWDPREPMALVNKQVLSPGSIINECKIEKIEKESIILSKDGVLFRITFEPTRPEDVKKDIDVNRSMNVK